MRIEHLALLSPDIEALREFYCRHFSCEADPRYENTSKGFHSFFLSFGDGARIEIMQKTGVTEHRRELTCGLAHFAFSVRSKEAVRTNTSTLKA